jgi:hypothetical protein
MRYQRGSCIICGQGTDTALGFKGSGEAHIAFLIVLGVAEDEASATVSVATNSEPGMVPSGKFVATYRLCARCVREAEPDFPPPVLLMVDGEIPVIEVEEP